MYCGNVIPNLSLSEMKSSHYRSNRRALDNSISFSALWNKAESVELILPNLPNQNFVTKKHFSYYKFFVPDDVDNFKLKISNCIVRLNERPIGKKSLFIVEKYLTCQPNDLFCFRFPWV